MIVLAAFGARTPRNLGALALAVPGVYLLTDVALEGDPLGVAFAFVNAALFAAYIVVSHRAAQNGSVPGIDLLGMAMLIAAVVATPIGVWGAAARVRATRWRSRPASAWASPPRSSPT